MRHLLTESSTCGITRKVLLECALRAYNIEHFCVHQYTFTYEVIILNPWCYHSTIRVPYELKRGGAVLKGVSNVSHTVTMSTKQTIEEMIQESQHI